MKRLSICLPALALALALFVSVHAGSPATATGTAAAENSHYMQTAHFSISWNTLYTPKSETKKFELSYYWYIANPYDYYDQYTTVTEEAWEWFNYLGGIPVNTCPTGGVLLAGGYQTPQQPFPSVYLYYHCSY